MSEPLSAAEHVEAVKAHGQVFFAALRDASDAGVSHAILLPQLVLVYRQVFGSMPELPDGFTLGAPQ